MKNTDDEAPPEEEKPKATLADRKVEADDDDWLDDQPTVQQAPEKEVKLPKETKSIQAQTKKI